MSRAYTSNEIQAIIDEVWRRAFQVSRALHRDADVPAPPSVQEVVDHPYHGSDAPGQYKRPWLNDPRGRRGMPVSSPSPQMPPGAPEASKGPTEGGPDPGPDERA